MRDKGEHMPRFKKDVTDAEIELAQKSLMIELAKEFVKRDPIKFDYEKNRNNKVNKKATANNQHSKNSNKSQHASGVKNSSNMKSERDNPLSLSEFEESYLMGIINHPNMSVTARGIILHGLSADKNTKTKKELLSRRLINELTIQLGKAFGGTVKLLKLTENGYKALGKIPPKTRPERQGSLEHIWWQENIARDYEVRGYKVHIEQELNDKFADIGVEKNNELVAVEIELSPKNAIYNFRADINAGFNRVIIACKNIAVRKQIETQLLSFVSENPSYFNKSKVIVLSEFPFVKKLHKEVRGQ